MAPEVPLFLHITQLLTLLLTAETATIKNSSPHHTYGVPHCNQPPRRKPAVPVIIANLFALKSSTIKIPKHTSIFSSL
uniref:Secreted protein n=1 Tax=Populus trichocarpa TaxID=3694 RepID=A0A2K2A679_POPTR